MIITIESTPIPATINGYAFFASTGNENNSILEVRMTGQIAISALSKSEATKKEMLKLLFATTFGRVPDDAVLEVGWRLLLYCPSGFYDISFVAFPNHHKHWDKKLQIYLTDLNPLGGTEPLQIRQLDDVVPTETDGDWWKDIYSASSYYDLRWHRYTAIPEVGYHPLGEIAWCHNCGATTELNGYASGVRQSFSSSAGYHPTPDGRIFNVDPVFFPKGYLPMLGGKCSGDKRMVFHQVPFNIDSIAIDTHYEGVKVLECNYFFGIPEAEVSELPVANHKAPSEYTSSIKGRTWGDVYGMEGHPKIVVGERQKTTCYIPFEKNYNFESPCLKRDSDEGRSPFFLAALPFDALEGIKLMIKISSLYKISDADEKEILREFQKIFTPILPPFPTKNKGSMGILEVLKTAATDNGNISISSYTELVHLVKRRYTAKLLGAVYYC